MNNDDIHPGKMPTLPSPKKGNSIKFSVDGLPR